jgi:methylmalonyl-CoA mutase
LTDCIILRPVFEDFKKDNYAAWSRRVEQELKGKTPSDLEWKNEDGLEIEPYYGADGAARLFPVISSRKEDSSWDVFEPIEVTDVKAANARALHALANGATGLCFFLPEKIGAADLSLMLQEIALPYIQTGFVVSPAFYADFCLFLAEYVRQRGYDPAQVKGYVQADFNRVPEEELPGMLQELVYHVPACAAALKGMRLFVIDVASYREAGCTAAMELGILLAWFCEWLEAAEGMGIPYDKISSLWQINLGNSGDYFLELAKYRVSNFLLSRVASRYGLFKPAYLMGNTALFNKSIIDPYNNLLRATSEAMSAVSGMCNGLQAHPFQGTEGREQQALDRIYRNIQLILRHEARLEWPEDPAAGAYYPEELSYALADKAWDYFLDIQKEGGLIMSLKSGYLWNSIAAAALQKAEGIKKRRIFQLGVNQYPPADSKLPERKSSSGVDGRNFFRQAAAFEELHYMASAYGIRRGKPLEALLLTFGDVKMRNARAGFARNFIGCSGIKVTEFLWDKGVLPEADLLVFCSSDEEYARALATLPPAQGLLVMAGNPGEEENKYRSAGIRHFIHVKTPLHLKLTELLEELGAYP